MKINMYVFKMILYATDISIWNIKSTPHIVDEVHKKNIVKMNSYDFEKS